MGPDVVTCSECGLEHDDRRANHHMGGSVAEDGFYPHRFVTAPGIFEAWCSADDAREWFACLWPHRHEAGDLHRPFLRWLIERARS